MKEYSIKSLEELPAIAESLINYCINDKFFAFYGEMGAGKTTLINSLCKHLNVLDPVSSPTYSIVNEYQGDKKIYHMDFYRLKSPEEALNIGLEDYFNDDAVFFMEWPEMIDYLLPKDAVEIRIKAEQDTTRTLTIKHP